jgi:arabinose-5-phosphate isomerase
MLVLGDALACALMEVRGFKAKDFARFHPGGSLGKRLLTTAHDVMRTDELPVVPPDMPMGEAVFHVSKGRLGLCVALVDNKVIGIITDGDVRRAMENSQDQFFRLTVGDVMTYSPKCVSPDTKISDIQDIMGTYKIHAVLIVDEEKHLLGIVDHFSCML